MIELRLLIGEWIHGLDKRVMNFIILTSGSLAGIWEWLDSNKDFAAYWLVIGVGTIVLRVLKFRQDLVIAREKHKLEIRRLEQELLQDQERHDYSLSKNNDPEQSKEA